jgi:hypothetical protein
VTAYTMTSEGELGADGQLVGEARCDDGDAVLSGGFETDGVVRSSMAFGDPRLEGWRVVARPERGTRLLVDVICSDVAPLHETGT